MVGPNSDSVSLKVWVESSRGEYEGVGKLFLSIDGLVRSLVELC